MANINRRKMLHVLGSAPAAAVAVSLVPGAAQAGQASAGQAAPAAGATPYQRRFFTEREYATVVALSDMIIPRDARSGSASEAGAPEFIDYICAEQPERQTLMRGGLMWLDSECRRRFDRAFLECAEAERRQVLDDIAWPARARPEMSHGVRFFTQLRDLVATGFWSSRMGVEDLGYTGNRPTVWQGAPREVLEKLGL
jgi:gluconate 2-dehydrogenase gamma chain